MELRTITWPMPQTLALSMASRMALAAATVPMPLCASTSARAGLSLTISSRARGIDQPCADPLLIAAQAPHALAVAGVEAQLGEDQGVGKEPRVVVG